MKNSEWPIEKQDISKAIAHLGNKFQKICKFLNFLSGNYIRQLSELDENNFQKNDFILQIKNVVNKLVSACECNNLCEGIDCAISTLFDMSKAICKYTCNILDDCEKLDKKASTHSKYLTTNGYLIDLKEISIK